MNPITGQIHDETRNQMRELAKRMRSGTGVSNVIGGQTSATHYMDSLERFQKDFSVYQKQRREVERLRREQEIQNRRIQYLERENKRWQVVEEQEQLRKLRMQHNFEQVQMGKKRTCNSNGLAYNPINLAYDKNPEGEKLRLKDEDHKIRGFVRAYNMDHHGNSAYNPLNGLQRNGVNKIIPPQLSERYQERLRDFEDHRRIKLPQSSNQPRRNHFRYY